jgi:uncharacterized protein
VREVASTSAISVHAQLASVSRPISRHAGFSRRHVFRPPVKPWTYLVEKTITDEFGSIILSFGYAGLLLWTVHSGHLKFLQRGLAAVGRTALTNYLMQSVIMNVLFMGFAFGFYDKLSRSEVLIWISAAFVLQIAASAMWLRSFAMGPIEWVWRSLTYR